MTYFLTLLCFIFSVVVSDAAILITGPNGTPTLTPFTNLSSAVSSAGIKKVTLSVTSNYTVNSLTIPATMTIQPINGAIITIASGKTLTLNGTLLDSGVQCFAGAGSVAGLKETTPELFGVTGTNDHTPIQKAINAAAKIVMDGTYYLGAGVTIPSNKEITGKGTIYRKTGSGVYDMFVNSDVSGGNINIKISGITVDGNKDADGLVATDAADRFSGISFTKVSGDSYIKDCTIKNTVNNETGAGIYLDTCIGVLIENNTVTGHDRTGIIYFNGSECRFIDNIAYSNSGSGISGGGCTDAIFSGNRTYSNGSGGNYTGLNVSCIRARVANNLSYSNTGSGIAVGEAAYAADGAQLTGNISYSNTYEGITVTNSNKVKILGGELSLNVRNNLRIISGDDCAIIGLTSKDSAGGQGIYLDAGLRHIVNGCTITGNAGSGIAIDSTSTDNTITNNIIYSNGVVTSANSAGILVNTTTNNTIAQNRIFDLLGAGGTQESGIWLAAGSGNIVSNNILHTNKTNSIRETSSPSYARVKNKIGTDSLIGSFTATAGGATTTVNNNNVTATTRVKVWPLTTASWSRKVAVTAVVAGTSFTVSTADGNFAGTEAYVYEIE